MATALQQQLAAIAANSTHQLDLKAQKQRHSKSLLFEPRDAATQSFDTIFQICYEGFEELCMLDSRFSPYARNLFSEQSKNEDRTQMTAKENEELDKTLESFLGLVCGRLLLKPAVNAVEWLVRRFRVQEYNTECMLLTFLPYHTSHIFPTLLSILPEQLPLSFRFLHPYVASLQCPPRHAVLQAAISNQNFFSALSQYVLRVAKAKQHSAVLLGFWASITAQAVSGMVDTSRSGRDNIRKQREEDLLLRILPVLQSALSIKGIPELYLGACMIMTILATKASVEDHVLDAMQEAVTAAWTTDTIEEGLTCLAVLAEEKSQVSQPATVTKRLLKNDEIVPKLIQIGNTHRISKLVAATATGTVEQMKKEHDSSKMHRLELLLNLDFLANQDLVVVLERIITILKDVENEATSDFHQEMSGTLSRFAERPETSGLIGKAAANLKMNLSSLNISGLDVSEISMDEDTEPVPRDEMVIDTEDSTQAAAFSDILNRLPELGNQQTSLLEPNHDELFEEYAKVFHTALASKQNVQSFLDLAQLQRSQIMEHPTFLSFLMRIWTSSTYAPARVAALDAAGHELQTITENSGVDTQSLIPYVLSALADSSAKVRSTAAGLCRTMFKLYGSNGGKNGRMCPVGNIYGASTPRSNWLSSEDAFRFLRSAVIPILEDSVVDGAYVSRAIVEILNTGSLGTTKQTSDGDKNELKKSIRSDACTFLAVHAVATPVVALKLDLLQILNKVGKAAMQARSNVMVPYVREYLGHCHKELSSVRSKEGTALHILDKTVIGSLTQRTTDEVQLLKDVAAIKNHQKPELVPIALERLRHLFPSMNGSQLELVDFLLDLSLDESPGNGQNQAQDSALEILRTLSLPTEVVVHLIESLPKVSDLQEQSPPSKKQRMSKPDTSHARDIDQNKLQVALRKITLVLELIEASKPEQHPPLLKGLFHLLSELHHYKTLLGSELVYLHSILLGCLLSVVEGLKTRPDTNVDRSVIRTDLIVECVRTTSSTQVHNTALLLVSNLASWAPELVLHSVMPLFTFMSSTLLRQSDEYSAHVTDQTVARVIPPLAVSLKKKGKNLVSGVSELLLSFIAAFEHIPLHRRAGLFEHLVETLGPDETLFAVIAMLIERYSEHSQVSAFVADLINHFPPLTGLKAASQYLDLGYDGFRPKRSLSDVLLGLNDKDSDEVEDSIDTLLEGLGTLLRNGTLRKRLAKDLNTNDENAESIRSTYASLLEQTMVLTNELKSNESLSETANALLLSVLGLMPTRDFINSSAQLMQAGSDETRQQVFRSLEQRVSQAKSSDSESQQVFIDVLPNCALFIREDQPVATRHAAISCIDQISEKYGKTDRAAVLQAAEQIAGPAALGHADKSLENISILCLASMVEILGDECIPILPNVLSQTLQYVSLAVKHGTSDPEIPSAAFGLFNAILDQLPWMLSASYLDQALEFAALAASGTKQEQIESNLIQDFSGLIAKKVNAGELFAAIERTWANVRGHGVEALYYHLKVLHQAIQQHTKATVTKNAQTLFAVLLEAFDLRRLFSQSDAGNEDHTELYTLVDDLALDMTLKLNDATFKPLFIRLVDWATKELPKKDTDGRTLRGMSLFSFSLTLFERLKSIVTSYSSFLLESASEQLLRSPVSGTHERQLLDLVLQTLSSSFNHDQDDFWQSPAHFEAVANPLVSQLKNASSQSQPEQVIPTITDLAAAAASPEHHKAMNTRIMSYMRDEEASVRLAAVKCERSITERVHFDWLSLLPEMLPVISELQEDDDEDVERETLRWVQQIEEITGENLAAMLA